MKFEVYCDEALPDLFTSQRPRARYLMIGSLWLPAEMRDEAKARIAELRAMDWSAPDHRERLAELARGWLSDYVRGYLEKGNQALVVYDDRDEPQSLGEGFSALDGPEPFWRVLRAQAQLVDNAGDAYRALRLAEAALFHAQRVRSRLGAARVQQLLAQLCDKAGLGNKAERYRTAAINEMRTLGDRRATAELLLSDTPRAAVTRRHLAARNINRSRPRSAMSPSPRSCRGCAAR